MKNDNPQMLAVHYVIHRENLVAKNMSSDLNAIMKAAVKCINLIKALPKTDRLFKVFCTHMEEAHVRLLLHCEVGDHGNTAWTCSSISTMLSPNFWLNRRWLF